MSNCSDSPKVSIQAAQKVVKDALVSSLNMRVK